MHYGNNGILKGAEYATDKYQNKAEQEQNELAKIDDYIQNGRANNENANKYSENEQIIGTWIDGKTIYQKTVDCGTLPNNALKKIQSNIENFEHLISIKGVAFSSSMTQQIPLPYVHPDSIYSIMLDFRENDITILTKCKDFSNLNAYVTIQYTKTTVKE